jgi:D-hydroxyproline dehydrogenase subunit gamma
MPESVRILVDGRAVEVAAGTSLAVALFDLGVTRFRTSVTGEPRGPICAMGICYECRVTVNGVPHRRACLLACADGMRVETGG